MDSLTQASNSTTLLKSPNIEIISDCDFDNKYYFNRSEHENVYYLKFPWIFSRNERRNYSILAYLECKDDSFKCKYFTTHEYMQIIHKLWDIPVGEYFSQTYFDQAKQFFNKEPLNKKKYLKTISDDVKKILNGKLDITIQKMKLWFEPSWSQKSNEQLQMMIKCNMDGNCMGLRIVFAQKSFGCFITF